MARSVLQNSAALYFSTKDVEAKDSFAYWKDMVCNHVINVDCEKSHSDADFNGRLRVESYGDVVLSEMHSQACRFIRNPEHIQKAKNDFILVTLRLDSKARKTLDAKTFNITSGDISIYHGTRPSRLHVNDNVDALIYQFPINNLYKFIKHPEDLHGSLISNKAQLGKLISNYMLTLAAEVGRIAPTAAPDIFDNFLQLLFLGLSSDKQNDMQAECVQLPLRTQIKDYITLNLANPLLSPEYIARNFRISLRYLYNLFENDDATLCQFIMNERLTFANKRLLQESPTRSISEIAFDSGFNNISHFCKIFKKRYNITPSEFRGAGKTLEQP